MSYRDVPADEAERLKELTKPSRDLERVTLSEECDKFARYKTHTDAQSTRWMEVMDSLEFIDRLDKHDEIREAAKDPRRVVEPNLGRTQRRPGMPSRTPNINYRSAGRAWQVRDSRDGDEVRGRAVDALVAVDASDEAIERAYDAMLDQSRHPEEVTSSLAASRSAPTRNARAFAKPHGPHLWTPGLNRSRAGRLGRDARGPRRHGGWQRCNGWLRRPDAPRPDHHPDVGAARRTRSASLARGHPDRRQRVERRHLCRRHGIVGRRGRQRSPTTARPSANPRIATTGAQALVAARSGGGGHLQPRQRRS